MNIQKIFDKVRKSYPEINSKLKKHKKNSFMISDPFSGNIFYNEEQLERHNFSEKALTGAIAHEFGHQIDYKRINIIQKVAFVIKYKKDMNIRKQTEQKADKITIQRGYGNELIQLLKESEQKFEKQRWLKLKKTHLSIKEIKKLMKKK